MSASPKMVIGKPDFPDWFSPMLVKELRQGMRARVFLSLFIIVQGAMVLLAFVGLIGSSLGDSNSGVTVFFWLIVGVPLVIIMPATGLGAVAGEKLANTLEPIFLTRLTARRILVGKWIAIVGQTMLLVTAILPYAMLRYYVGGVNLVMELETLGAMLTGSALLSAVAVGLSPLIGRVMRALIPVAGVIVLLVLLNISFISFRGSVIRGGGSGGNGETYAVIVLLGVVFAAFMLEVGAGKVAPAAENHATSKRLLALFALAIGVTYSCHPGASPLMWIPVLIIIGLVIMGALGEPVAVGASTYRPFLRRGMLGRMLGRLFYPGWPAGTFFTLVVLAVVVFRFENSVATIPGVSPLYVHLLESAWAGALLMPMAIYRLMNPKRMAGYVILRAISAPVFYLSFHGLFALLALLGVLVRPRTLDWTSPTGFELLVACHPTVALCYFDNLSDWGAGNQLDAYYGVTAFTVASILILLARSWPAWRTISKLEKTASQTAPTVPLPDAIQPAVAD